MGHVRLDEVAGGEGRAERKFAGEDACGDDLGELLGVLAGSGGVGAAHAEEVELLVRTLRAVLPSRPRSVAE